jgi:hypothetical protein
LPVLLVMTLSAAAAYARWVPCASLTRSEQNRALRACRHHCNSSSVARETPQLTGSRLLINAADSRLLGCPALQVADTPAVQAGGVQADPELFALDHLNDVLVTGVGLAGE